MDTKLVEADRRVVEDVFSVALKNQDFKDWFQFCYRKLLPIRDDKYRFKYNISEITFSVHQYPNGEVARKIAIGVFGDFYNKEAKRYFFELVKKLCPKAEEVFKSLEWDKVYGVGIGVEYNIRRWIWKFYVMTEDGRMVGINCENGKIIEVKHYRLHEKIVSVKGKHKRKQINVEACGVEALKALKMLRKYGYINNKAYSIAEQIVLRDMCLDTISISKTRGIALYFE